MSSSLATGRVYAVSTTRASTLGTLHSPAVHLVSSDIAHSDDTRASGAGKPMICCAAALSRPKRYFITSRGHRYAYEHHSGYL